MRLRALFLGESILHHAGDAALVVILCPVGSIAPAALFQRHCLARLTIGNDASVFVRGPLEFLEQQGNRVLQRNTRLALLEQQLLEAQQPILIATVDALGQLRYRRRAARTVRGYPGADGQSRQQADDDRNGDFLQGTLPFTRPPGPRRPARDSLHLAGTGPCPC